MWGGVGLVENCVCSFVSEGEGEVVVVCVYVCGGVGGVGGGG